MNRILIAAGTLAKAEQIRTDLGLPHATRLSTYHRGAGRGFVADVLLIDDTSCTTEDLQTLLPCTYGGEPGRAYRIEELR